MDVNFNIRRKLFIQCFATEPTLLLPSTAAARSCTRKMSATKAAIPSWENEPLNLPVSWATRPLISWHFLTLDLVPQIFLYKQRGESCGKQKGEIGHTRNSETSANLLFKVINSVTSDHKADLQFASRG